MNGTFGPVTNQSALYPYLAVLNDLKNLMSAYKLDRFTLAIRFMARDLSDVNGDGKFTDLRYYQDSNGDQYDDYDGTVSTSGLRYLDQNADGDFRDTYFNGSEITEEPHTRLKEAVLKVYKSGDLVSEETRLISWEKFTGAEGKAAGASLRILVSSPSENSSVYSLANSGQQAAFNLPISQSYASDIFASRADAASPLRMVGETTPVATVSWKIGTSTNPTLNSCFSDVMGSFDCTVSNVTANLIEGTNTVLGQTVKSVYYSPWTPTTFIYDINPPSISSQTPTLTIPNLQPIVYAVFADTPVIAGRSVAGVNPSVLTLFHGTSTVNRSYNGATGKVLWVDSATGLPPVLSTGTHTMVLEGGDNAYYKARSTWTFTVDVGDFTDASKPSVSQKSPSGAAGTNYPTVTCKIFDNQSGISLHSLSLAIDGSVVVSSGTGNLLSSVEPLSNQDGYQITYAVESALSSGWHTATVTARHWATSPAGSVNETDSWNFNVP